MRGRAYVMIFFFWAVLAVITPTLVIWSESSKLVSQSQGDKSGATGLRRMMGYAEMHLRREMAPEMEEEPVPSPAPPPVDASVADAGNQTSVSLLQMTSNNEIQARRSVSS